MSVTPPLTVGDWLRHAARRRGSHPLLVWLPFEGPGRTLSYEGFAQEVAALAGGLRERGIGVGDRVLIHLDNGPETLVLRFACAWLGAVAVATNTAAIAAELAPLALRSRVRAAVTSARHLGALAGFAGRLDWIAIVGDAPSDPAGSATIPFADLMGTPVEPEPLDASADAWIMFTTGSTAQPKGVVWSHANVLWAAQLNAQQQQACPADVHLLFLPLFHVVGLSWAFLATMFAGGTVVLQPRFSASRFWDVAIATRATVSSHVNFTVASVMRRPLDGHAFRRWITVREEHAVQRRLGIEMVAGWGMTEVLAQVVVSTPGLPAADGSIGRPSLAYRVRVEDDAGRPVAPGSAGHLVVHGVPGVSIFSRYDDDPQATAEAFDAQGGFRTGDSVELCVDGSIRFVERIKDVVKVGGENVSALEVEQFLARLPGVREAAVVGMPDALYGEVVVAFVVVEDGPADPAPALIAACEAGLSRYKVPRRVWRVKALPRIGVGKVAKAALRQALAAPDVVAAVDGGAMPVNVLGAGA